MKTIPVVLDKVTELYRCGHDPRRVGGVVRDLFTPERAWNLR
jgi:hypothetical protein